MYGDYIKYYLDYAVGIWVLVDVAKKTETTISVDEAIKWSKHNYCEMSLDARGIMDSILEDYKELSNV
jgi:hypothetical protein|tara:strand:- start:749 stop:952 length:204 start_codon:yes stop_codon:yes gene_type:complete